MLYEINIITSMTSKTKHPKYRERIIIIYYYYYEIECGYSFRINECSSHKNSAWWSYARIVLSVIVQ